MFRSLSTAVLLLLLALPGVALAQNTGKLSGRVTDATTGDPLIGANVYLSAIQRGAATDIDGNYTILGIPVGQYDIQYSYTGYQQQTISDVEISQGRTRQLDIELSSTIIGEVIVEYERPLIQQDAIGVPRTVTGEDIQNLPVRGVGAVAAIQPGVVSGSGADGLNIRGGRTEEVTYYIDGVKVIGSAAVPQTAIAEQEMLIGTIPPQYGDATAGVISISTRSGGNEFFGSAEAITSQGLDAFGYNLGSLTLGGPIVRDMASFFLSVQGTYQQDASPYAFSTLQLNDDIYNAIQQSPQVFRVDRGGDDADGNPLEGGLGNTALFSDDDYFYFPIPTGFTDMVREGLAAETPVEYGAAELAEALGISEDAISALTPINAINFINSEDYFTSSRGKDDPSTDFASSGNIEFRPVAGVNIRVGGAYTFGRDRAYSYTNSFFTRDQGTESTDRVGRGYVSLRQVLSNTAFYQIQAEFSDRFFQSYPESIGSNIEDILLYGDIDSAGNEYNRVATRYLTYDSQSETFEPSYLSDGRYTPGDAFGETFNGPGTNSFGYSKFAQQQFRVFGSAQTQVGVHELSFGGEYETQTQRSFAIASSQARSLAGCFNDASGNEINCRDTDGDGVNDAGVDSYSQISASAGASGFTNPTFASYYGYDYLGLNEVDEGNIADFYNEDFTGTLGVAPRKPVYYGGYVRDRIEYRDLVIDLGLRLDVFDNNTATLRDPYALREVVRVSDVGSAGYTNPVSGEVVNGISSRPGNIDDDFAVLVSGGNVIGYRDRFGQFYNAAGSEVNLSDPTIESGSSVQLGNGQLTDASFEDYEPQLTLMPRVGVTFPVTDRALFFASYNVTSQRPSENAFATIQDFYDQSSSPGNLNNPGLVPETTTQYELGFRQAVGDRAAFTLSGYYRTQRNKIGIRPLFGAFPATYNTYRNVDFTTTKGLEFAFDLRRTRNLQVNANYTLSFAEGTGSDSNTAFLTTFRTQSYVFPLSLAPLDYDQRHNLNVSVDYRLGDGEGPMIGGVRPFSGFGVNFLGVFKSGNRYTQIVESATNSNYASTIGIGADGEINGTVVPSTFRVDMKVDRAFNLGGVDLTGYVWVQNLLDSDNVIGVYRTTGLPDNDGFLDSDGFQSAIANLDPIQQQSYRFLYDQYVGGPVGVGTYKRSGTLYSSPRQIRLGLTLGF